MSGSPRGGTWRARAGCVFAQVCCWRTCWSVQTLSHSPVCFLFAPALSISRPFPPPLACFSMFPFPFPFQLYIFPISVLRSFLTWRLVDFEDRCLVSASNVHICPNIVSATRPVSGCKLAACCRKWMKHLSEFNLHYWRDWFFPAVSIHQTDHLTIHQTDHLIFLPSTDSPATGSLKMDPVPLF